MQSVPDRQVTSQPEQTTARLLETYLQVTELPDDVAALWDGYHEQQRTILKMAQAIGRLMDRVERLERRDRMRGAS